MNARKVTKFGLTLGLFALWTTMAVAQSERLRGRVIALDSTREAVAFANVINTRTLVGAYTDERGYFTLSYQPGDTLIATAVGYVRQRVVPALRQPTDTLVVGLRPTVYRLSPVTVRAEREVLRIPGVDSYTGPPRAPKRVRLGWNNPAATDMVPSFGPRITIDGPITALYNRFSRQGREAARLKEAQSRDEREAAYQALKEEKVKPAFVSRILDLEGEELHDFMKYFRPQEAFLRRANEYELILELKRWHKKFEAQR